MLNRFSISGKPKILPNIPYLQVVSAISLSQMGIKSFPVIALSLIILVLSPYLCNNIKKFCTTGSKGF